MIYEVLIRSDDLLLAIDNWDLGKMIDMWQYCFDQFLNIENFGKDDSYILNKDLAHYVCF